MQWLVCQWKLLHPKHGTFFVGRLTLAEKYSASRVFDDASQESGLRCEQLGMEYDSFASLEDAQAAVERRIAELDAASAPEQLEACR